MTAAVLRKKAIGTRVLWAIVALATIYFAARECEINLSDLLHGLAKGSELISYFFPPSWNTLPSLFWPCLSTVILALIATPIGALLSLPLGLAAARNISPRWLSLLSRFLIGVERGLPEIVVLLFLVVLFGLGPLPAVLALGVASIGMLAKFIADSAEEVPATAMDAIACTGASKWNVIRYGIVPEILPSFVANTIFRFEFNVRASILLGAAGAGGIGYELFSSMAGLDYRRSSVAILLLIGISFAAERTADHLRRRLLSVGLQ